MNGKLIWSIKNRVLDLSTPRIMAILNVTPDSFSDGGSFLNPEKALERAVQIQEEGADLIDIGAESTRPGAAPIAPEEEWRRLAPVLKILPQSIQIPISVDTRHHEVAECALQQGAHIINDVSCANSPRLLQKVAEYSAGYILMHSRGEPAHMLELAHYKNLLTEVKGELEQGLSRAQTAGISLQKIVLDPGLGFAKTPSHNWKVLQNLLNFRIESLPLLIGVSRKSMIREQVGFYPKALLGGSLAAAFLALENGAQILRVHDVGETVALVKVWQSQARDHFQ